MFPTLTFQQDSRSEAPSAAAAVVVECVDTIAETAADDIAAAETAVVFAAVAAVNKAEELN